MIKPKILVFLIVTSLTNGQELEESQKPAAPLNLDPFVTAANEFGYNLINEMNPSVDGGPLPKNVLFSPFSLAMSLAGVYQTADEHTSKEFSKVLEFDKVKLEKSEVPKKVDEAYNSLYVNDSFLMSNVLVVHGGKDSLPELFTKSFQENFHGQLVYDDESNTVGQINTLIEEKTHLQMKNDFTELPESCSMMLWNVVHYEPKWKYPFYKDQSREDVFFGPNEQKYENVTYMWKDGNFGFVTLTDLDADLVELPFKGDHLNLYVVLPRDVNDDLSYIRSSLNVSYVELMLSQLQYRHKLTIIFPRLQLDMKYYHPEMTTLLNRLGLASAFDKNQAKFSTPQMYLSHMYLRFKMNLVEASLDASNTSNDQDNSPAARPVMFEFNHPFLYFVRNKNTGQMLALGEVHQF